MDDEAPEIGRRRLLELVGSGAAVSVAGCSGPPDQASGPATTATSTGTERETSGGTTDDATATATATPRPDIESVTITQGTVPSKLDPQNHRKTPTDIVVRQMYEGLLSRDRVGKIVPELATEWKRLEPGKVRFQIRSGPTFHETGNELTPEDVAYSINRIVDDDVGIESRQKGQLAGVTRAEVVEGADAVDVYSDGLNPLVFPEFATYCDILEKEWVTDDETDINNQANGTGPFRLEEYTSDEVVLERNDDYWRDPAPLSEVRFNGIENAGVRVDQLINGSSDLIVNAPPGRVSDMREADGVRIEAAPSTRIIYNAMRTDVPPFSSKKFRKAMNYSIDLSGIVNDVLLDFGDETSQPTLEGFFGYNSQVSIYSHDPGKAEQLVAESGQEGVSLELHTPSGRYLKDVEIAQAVADHISELPNVDCSVKQREFEALVNEITDGDIETSPKFYLIGWGNATFHAVQTIDPTLSTDGTLTTLKDDKVDRMIDRSMRTESPDERERILQDLNAYLHDVAPWVFLNRQYSLYGVTDRVDWEARRDERIDAYAIKPA